MALLSKAALDRIPEPKEKYDPWGVARPAEPAKKSKQMARMAKGTGIAPAGNVASTNEDNTIKAKRKRFVMFPPDRCEAMT